MVECEIKILEQPATRVKFRSVKFYDTGQESGDL